jgi:PAS domain S-box-containing protein
MGSEARAIDPDCRRMRQAIDASGEVMFMTDRNGTITFVNSEFEKLYGYAASEVVGRVTPRILTSGLADRATYASFWEALWRGEVVRTEFTNRTKSGVLLHMEGSANPIRGEDNEITGFLAVQRDVTSRNEADRLLRSSEARYRTLAEGATDAIFIIGADERFEYMNRSAAALFRRSPNELIGSGVRDCFPPKLAENVEDQVREVRRTRAPLFVEQPMSFPRGETWQSAWLAPLFDDAGLVTSVMGISRDITERMQLATLLERQHHLLSAIVTNSPIGMAVLSGESLICDTVNPALQQLVPDRQLTGLPIADTWPGASAGLIQMFRGVLRTGVAGECLDLVLEASAAGPDGYRTVTVSASPLHSSAAPNSILVLVIDTSARKRLEAQFFQAQKMEAIGRLAGGVAHDFNNLLTSILGYAELLRDTLDPDDPRRSDVKEIQHAGESAAALTRHLLAFSRKQIVQPGVIDLNKSLRRFEKIVRRTIGEDIQVSLETDPFIDRITIDSGQLEQIVLNLSVNARDAMPRGGRLEIRTANLVVDRREGANDPVPPGRYAVLTLTDNGAGMSDEVRAHLFEPFFTTKPFGKGTGLGLSTVYGIVKQNDGFIAVKSEPNRGTTITIYLKGIDEPETAAAEITEPFETGTETILVAEDNDALRALARKTLQSCGYRVLAARDAEEALKLANAYSDPIHLLLTDVVMPGADGLDLSRAVVRRHRETRVLFMSGHTDEVVSHHGLLDGNVRFLQKPFTRNTVARAIRQVLDSPGTVDPQPAGDLHSLRPAAGLGG